MRDIEPFLQTRIRDLLTDVIDMVTVHRDHVVHLIRVDSRGPAYVLVGAHVIIATLRRPRRADAVSG
jgi:hypothetical protein